MARRNLSISRFRFFVETLFSAKAVSAFVGIVLLLCSCRTSLHAQQSTPSTILFGPIVEAEGKISLADNPISLYSLSSACGTFDRMGEGRGMRFGVEGRIVPAGWTKFGLNGRIAVETGSERFTALPLDEQRTVNEMGEIETLQREFRLDYSSTTLVVEPLLNYRLGNAWSIAAGLRAGYRLKAEFQQTDNVLGPGDRRFEDGQATHQMETGIDFTSARWSLGPVLATSYLVPLKNGLIVAPQLSFRADLLSPTNEAPWRTFSLSAGGALFFNLSPQPPAPALPPDQPIPPPVPDVPLPQARIQIRGLDDSGQETEVGSIRMWEVLYEQRLPLLPSMFFDRGSATLPERYATDPALSPEVEFSAATTDSTEFDWTLMKANHHLPGILAERMERNPESILEIAGSTSEEETPQEGEERSEEMKNFLTAQGIEAGRIRIVPPRFKRSDERTADGREENQRVEIASQNSELTDPLTLRQIVRDFSPPAIRVKPDFEAVAGVRRWRIEIRYNDSLMADYTSEERSAGEAPDFSWRITQRRGDTSVAPIVASFSIIDSLGRESTAWDTIQVVLQERRSVIDQDIEASITHERSSLWIIGFEYDSETLTERQKSEVEIIGGKIRDNAQVTVTGYTDRIGTESRNMVLSLQRAETVAAHLKELLARRGIANVQMKAVGEGVDQGLFNNDLPEGRHLSRSVVITVEQ